MPPIDANALLSGAEAARSRPAESAEVIERALAAAPHDADVRLAAYRFYFFAHDHARALGHAEALLAHAARGLNIAGDWRAVRPDDADFTAHRFAPGLYLQALIAIGYCLARTGARDEAAEALAQAARLDPSDRFGGGWLLAKLAHADADADGDDPA